MKKISFWTVLLAAFTVWLMIFSFPTLAKSLRIDRVMPFYVGEKREPVMLTVWHIDSFEGGKNSRGNWLSDRAEEYEKKNSRLYITVKNLSAEQALTLLGAGETPDMISYGNGLLNKDSFIALKEREGLLDSAYASGTCGGELKAVPYFVGGYVMLYDEQSALRQGVDGLDPSDWADFAQKLELLTYERKTGKNKVTTVYSLIYGKDTYTSAENAFNFISDGDISPSLISPLSGTLTPAKAFEQFASGGASVLIGTQRDCFRLLSRQSNGKMASVKYIPLAGNGGACSDLIQYISVADSKHLDECEGFIDYLLSERVQKKLSNIGMFSVVKNCVGLYDDANLSALEAILHFNTKFN